MKKNKYRNQLKNEIIKIDKIDFNNEILRRTRIQKKHKVDFEKEILLFFSIIAMLIYIIDLKIININRIANLGTIILICLMPILLIFFKFIYNRAINNF